MYQLSEDQKTQVLLVLQEFPAKHTFNVIKMLSELQPLQTVDKKESEKKSK